ncbi:O-antigen ligase family protein [Bradyrhizobium sediminis]|uniref:O-antigen ligase family protein n=1 Tax=Bradyrhizobium sediminis TaxID=2840469 RepID=A0A975NM86_9BRAD|nr:O-antigen ligase family protein [Bradyrhizobium sediminis]QWG17425.1 O-antigen ligase family protein [Bradyrhizobium sediminis]
MIEAARREPGRSRLALVLPARFSPAAWILSVDLLTVLIAVLLPWSTSGVAIAAVLWLIALVPAIELRAFWRSLMRPVSALPIAIFALALAGTLWSEAAWGARLYAVGPAAKLLVLPLLLYHFERSSRGAWVFIAFLVSCTLLMLVSWAVAFEPSLTLKPNAEMRGIFVKNYIDQSQEFALCAVALAYPIMTLLRANRIRLAVLLAAVSLSLLANMMFVVVSRTALVTMPIMLAVFALLHLKWRTSLAISGAAVAIVGLAWTMSPQLQWTTTTFLRDYRIYKELDQPTSIGLRLEFWQKSLRFIAEAPVIGHGTGSTRGLFEQAATGPKVLAGSQVVSNPHNQTLHVAIQWGMLGVIVLYAMWWRHFVLFRGEGLAAWIGLLVVVQNIFTSLFNSHLFDFHEGWMYVLGVGVAGGMVLGARRDAGTTAFAAVSGPQGTRDG